MNDPLEFEGANLEEALSQASAALRLPAERLDYQVLEEGRKGFLGVGGRHVRIRVRPPEEIGRTAPPPDSEDLSDLSRLREFVERFVSVSPFDLEARVSEEEDKIRVDLDGADVEFLLERRGDALNALQVLLGRVATHLQLNKPVYVDSGGFRRNRQDELVEIALLTAEKVKRLREPQRLSAMNPYERRLVHLALKDDPEVETVSEGDGFLKQVAILPRPK